MAGGKAPAWHGWRRQAFPCRPDSLSPRVRFTTSWTRAGRRRLIAGVRHVPDVDDRRAVEHAAERIQQLIVSTPRRFRLREPFSPRTKSSSMATSSPSVRAPSAKTGSGKLRRPAGELSERERRRRCSIGFRECWASFFSPRALFLPCAEGRAGRYAHGGRRAGDGAGRQERRDVHRRSDSQSAHVHGHRRRAWPWRGDRVRPKPNRRITTWCHAMTARSSSPSYLMRRAAGVLSDQELDGLRTLGLRLEAFFGFPQDVEWCSRASELLLLQSRPITTLDAHG